MTHPTETIAVPTVTCAVCGRPTQQFGVVGHNEFLCMEDWPKDTEFAGTINEGELVRVAPCFGWFAGYAYVLIEVIKQYRAEYIAKVAADLPQLQAEFKNHADHVGRLMLLVKEHLARTSNYELLWALDRAQMFPKEGEPWPPSHTNPSL